MQNVLCSVLIVFGVCACAKDPGQFDSGNPTHVALQQALNAKAYFDAAKSSAGEHGVAADEKSRREFGQSIEFCRKALQIKPDLKQCWYWIGQSQGRLGMPQAAAASLENFLDAERPRSDESSQHSAALISYVELRTIDGNLQRGIDFISTLLDKNSDDAGFAAALVYLVAQVDLEKAKNIAKAYAEKAGPSAGIYYRACDGFSNTGIPQQISSCFSSLLEMPELTAKEKNKIESKVKLYESKSVPRQAP